MNVRKVRKVGKKTFAWLMTLLMMFSIFPFTATSVMAEGTTSATIYVAADGDDTTGDGSQAHPYKTLAKAKEAVRVLSKTDGDIVVEIADGFYSLDETLVFNASDSGSEDCTIHYVAAPGTKPVISGGTMLEKGVWEEAAELTQTGGLTAYKTTLHRDGNLRAIYVNGERANMTVSETIGSNDRTTNGIPTVSFTGEDNSWAWRDGSNIPAAIVFSADVGLTPDTKNPQNIEAERLGGARWARPFVSFASAETAPESSNMPGGTMLRFQMPYAAISQSLSNNTQYSPNSNQVIRNAFEFLNKRGDFYFDQAEDTLYYIPLEGEDINTAEVIVPEIETLIDIRGVPVGDRLDPVTSSDDGRVRYITFDGLTFAHTDYKLHELTGTYTLSDGDGPVTTSSLGFASVQGCIVNTAYFPSSINWHETFYRGYDIPPAAIRINAARNIKVLNGEIILTGFNGIHVENDVKDIEVTGNLIRDTLASAVVVGHPQHIYENDEPILHESDDSSGGVPIRNWAGVDKEKFEAGTEAVPQDIYITNNFMYRLGYGFPGVNGFTSFYTTNMQVLHNFIYDTTYGAMSIGWGWCEYDGFGHTSHGTDKTGSPYAGTSENSVGRSEDITTTSRNNKVNYNRVEEICTVVNDSGAIYTLGRQGDPGNLPGGGTWDTIDNLSSSAVTDPDSNWYHENWTNYTEMNYNFLNPNPYDRPTSSNDWTNGFHPDEGSTFIKMIGNVVQSKLSYSPGQSRLYELNNWKRKSDMIAIDGYVDGNNNQNGAPRITYDNYKSEDRIWPVSGNKIVLNAGLTDEYTDMIPRSLIADTEFELASNVIMGKGETLNRRGLLEAEDTVWLAPADTIEFIEGPTMTKAAGDEKTIDAPNDAGAYKLFIEYEDGSETAVSKYTVYVDTTASAVNVEDGGSYEVSEVRPLKLTLSDDYTYTLNGKPVEDGYEIATEGSWTLEIITSPTTSKTIKFTTTVSEANMLLTADVSVAPGGTVRFAYDLDDPTKKIWISSSSGGHFDGGDDETMTTGDALGMTAPIVAGPYVIFVLDEEDNVLSQSHACITVREMTPVDIPRDGLDLWLKADEGVKTDGDGNVIEWENMGNIPATFVPADVTSSGGDGLGTPTGNPSVQRAVYEAVYFGVNARPLKVADFKDYNDKTELTIYALVKPENQFNGSSDQNGFVYFGLNESDGSWAANDGWSGISLGVATGGVNIRFGNAVAWDGGGQSIPTSINGLSSVRAQLNGENRDVYVNNTRIGGATNATALAGNRSDLSIGYTMSSKTPHRFLGNVVQILIYDRVLKTDEITKIETYFDEVRSGGGGTANPIETDVDKTLLTGLIEKVNNLDNTIYTIDSWNALESALSEAETAASNNEIGQEDADDVYFALRDAFKALGLLPSGNGTAEYGTPVLGGEELDPLWDTTVTLPILKHLTMAEGPTNGTAKVLWDRGNLYVLVSVEDSVLNSSNGSAHEQDSTEIFVDETNSKSSSYGTGMGQYRINYLNEKSFNPSSISTGFESYAKVVDDGYYIETKIPFKVENPTVNHVIGFDLQINDAGETGSRQDIIMWHDESGQSWQNGSQWGEVTLVGEPDEVTIVELEEVNAITTVGTAPELPDVVTAVYSDNITELVNVDWDAIDEADYAQAGTFKVEGTVEGTDIKAIANITVEEPTVGPEPLIPLEGLDVWLKADDKNIVTDEDDRVLSWANLVDGKKLTPVNSANAPKLMQDEETDVPYDYIQIDSLDSRLEGDILKDYTGKTEMTIITVAQPTAEHNDFEGYGDKFSAVYINGTGDWGGVGITAATDGVHGRFGNGMGPWTSNDGPAPVVRAEAEIDSLVSIMGTKNSSVLSVSVNGKDGEIASASDDQTRDAALKNIGTTLAVGGVLNDEDSNRTEENAFKGRVAEVIIYNHELSEDELDSVNAYINTKYFSGEELLTGTLTIDNMLPKVGDTLTASLTDSNNSGTLTYEWFVGGVSAGSGETYKAKAADIGKTIKVSVTSSVEAGKVDSGETAAVAEANEIKPFIITPSGGLVREGGIKATVSIALDSEADTHSGTEAVVFQLMNGDTPVSIVALEKDITESEQMSAFFNVDPTIQTYSVQVFVFDVFDNSTSSSPEILADKRTIQ